jgi:hypothetical protein
MMGFGNHIVRLRSWRETKRTAWFCTAYFLAWAFDLLVPLMCLTLMALIAYPPCRTVLFPPAPLALVSGKGGVQKPRAGVLGSHDTATGAPENHKGEAVEQEASNFVNGIASVAISSAVGKHPQGEPESDKGAPADGIPDPTAIASKAAAAQDKAAGGAASAKKDKTKVPMETAIWTKMRPVMHAISDVTDGWERFHKLVSIHFLHAPVLTILQCSLTYASLSSKSLPLTARCCYTPNVSHVPLRNILYVHEGRNIRHRIRLLR